MAATSIRYAATTAAPWTGSTGLGIAPARIILCLIAFRWLAGIADNLGARGASEDAAITMLGVLAFLFLTRMRLARDAVWLVAGLLAWLFAATMSALATPMPRPLEAAALLTLLSLYALTAEATLAHLRSPRGLAAIRVFLTGFLLVGAALSVWQVTQGAGFVDPGKPGVIRAFGSDVHPVSFALQALAAMLALEVIRVKTGRAFNGLHATLLACGALALYLTYARTAWVMALLIAAVLAWRRSGGLQRLALIAVALPAGIGALSLSDRFADLASLPTFWHNFSFAETVFDYRYIDNSVSWRIVNWSYGLQQALERPLLGFGPGQSAYASQFSLEMHNILLEALFEGGILGLAAVSMVLLALLGLHRNLPAATPADRHARALANGFGAALLLAVLFSTSLVDQLMTVVLYLLLLASASTPSITETARRTLTWLPPSGSPGCSRRRPPDPTQTHP